MMVRDLIGDLQPGVQTRILNALHAHELTVDELLAEMAKPDARGTVWKDPMAWMLRHPGMGRKTSYCMLDRLRPFLNLTEPDIVIRLHQNGSDLSLDAAAVIITLRQKLGGAGHA